MLAECTKCGSSREIKLKVDGDSFTPVCTACGTVQGHFSKIMINTMKSNKDIIQTAGNEHIPFGFMCEKCKKQQELVYDKKAGVAKCGVCGTTANVSPYTLRSLELTGHSKRSSELTNEYDGGDGTEDSVKE